MKYFIDTNIFLRTLIKEDEKTFKDCQQFLKKVKEEKVKAVTAGVVLAEVTWTLTSYYQFSRIKAAQGTWGIINLKGLKIIDSYDHFLALDVFKNKGVKYIDALIASIKQIQLRKWRVVSYDRDFDKLGVKKIEPSEV